MIGIGISIADSTTVTSSTTATRLIRDAVSSSVSCPIPSARLPSLEENTTITSTIGHHRLLLRFGEEDHRRGDPERDVAEELHPQPRELQVLVGAERDPYPWRQFIQLVDRPLAEHHHHRRYGR